MSGSAPQLGIRANLGQFTLLVLVNALVGSVIGLERSILPGIAETEFGLVARTAIVSFIVVFGLSKALTNYFAGRLSEVMSRKRVLVIGWLVAVPVPFLLGWAPSWSWLLAANVLLGISQGLTWSATVIMKIDLAGPLRRGLAMGLNEFAGYLAVALSAFATSWIADRYGLRPAPFYLGALLVAAGAIVSIAWVRDTTGHALAEVALSPLAARPSAREVFVRTSVGDANLSSISQAGLVNNLNDGMAWGLFPIVFADAGLALGSIGVLVALYPAVWGIGQLAAGPLSDRIGRRLPIAAGMGIQAAGIVITAAASGFAGFAAGSVLLGLGTALVYPTLLAGIGDAAPPEWRASAMGVYRLWRDLGYPIGAVLAGVIADLVGTAAALNTVAALTLLSGAVAALRMRERSQESVRGLSTPEINGSATASAK